MRVYKLQSVCETPCNELGGILFVYHIRLPVFKMAPI
jgi:hypothetical protein